MFTILISSLMVASTWAADNFSATELRQGRDPYAFAITRESLEFHRELSKSALRERSLLISQIKRDSPLLSSIQSYGTLSDSQKEFVLKKVFSIQTRGLRRAPILTLGPGPKGQSAFFDFDPKISHPGKVYIDYKKLAQEDHPFASLLLLIHETRHSAQLQLGQTRAGALSHGYAEAFRVQKDVFSTSEKISFCDFMSLLNEYEAFQYANFVLNRLTNGSVNIKDMGTVATQYDQNGRILLDLPRLMERPESTWFSQFNKEAKQGAR